VPPRPTTFNNIHRWSFVIGAALALASIFGSRGTEEKVEFEAVASASTSPFKIAQQKKLLPTAAPSPTPMLGHASVADLRTALARDQYCEVKVLLMKHSYDLAELLQLIAETPRPRDFNESTEASDLLADARWVSGGFNSSMGHQQVEALAQAGAIQLPFSVAPDEAGNKLKQLQRLDPTNGAIPYFLATLEGRKGSENQDEEIRLWINSFSLRNFNLALESLRDSVEQRGHTNQSYTLLSAKVLSRLPTTNLNAGTSRILMLISTGPSDLALYSLGWASRQIYNRRYNSNEPIRQYFTTDQSESIYLASYQKLFPEEPPPNLDRNPPSKSPEEESQSLEQPPNCE